MRSLFNYFFLLLCCTILITACGSEAESTSTEEPESVPETPEKNYNLTANKVKDTIIIDGLANDMTWQIAEWHPIDQIWLGDTPEAGDFEGRFKLTWSDDFLYILAEIKDDVFMDKYEGLNRYWDDDCLEIFIDEDRSKGIHQYSHNAFAYHIGMDYQVADLGTDSLPHYYNESCIMKRTEEVEGTYIWEVAMRVYSDEFDDEADFNPPTRLTANKRIGFMVAYCDNDASEERENFFGSIPIEGEDKNRGWIDAGVFHQLDLLP